MDGFELNANHYQPRKGRSVGIVLGVVVLIAATAAGVWFWRQRDIDSLQARLQNVSQTPPTITETETAADPTDTTKWNQVTFGPTPLANDKLAGFSFKLPPLWTIVSCGSTEVLVAYVAPDSQSQTTCGTEGVSPIVVSAQPGDVRKSYRYNDTSIYTDFKSEEVVVNDEEFELSSALVEKPGEFGPAVGSTITSYVLFDAEKGITYAATYIRAKDTATNLSADFKQLVEKTLILTNTP